MDDEVEDFLERHVDDVGRDMDMEDAATLSSTTILGNVGGGEDDLVSYTMPANTLAADGDTLRVFAAGVFLKEERRDVVHGVNIQVDTTGIHRIVPV